MLCDLDFEDGAGVHQATWNTGGERKDVLGKKTGQCVRQPGQSKKGLPGVHLSSWGEKFAGDVAAEMGQVWPALLGSLNFSSHWEPYGLRRKKK